MRRLIVSNLMSLDGFFESPEKNVKWFPVDEEFFAYAKDMLGSTETLLFGGVSLCFITKRNKRQRYSG